MHKSASASALTTFWSTCPMSASHTHFLHRAVRGGVDGGRTRGASEPAVQCSCIFHTAALASLGRLIEAVVSAEHLLELEPGFRIGPLISSYSSNKERLAMLASALRLAGLPE